MQADGQSLRSHLQAVEKITKRKPLELDQIELPTQVRYLWQWFCELSVGRGVGQSGYLALSWIEIKAWADITGRSPNHWEMATIRAIDTGWLYG